LAELRDAPEDSLLEALDETVWAGLVQETGADGYRLATCWSAPRWSRSCRRLVGEVEMRDSDIGGIAVHIAARVMAAGSP
jgi:hypothetical protein